MKKTLNLLIHNLTYNFKTLIAFLLIYRFFGLLIIFPLIRFLFLLSIRLYGSSYINNRLALEYLLSPTTIIILLILLLIITFYIVVELIFLTIIFDFGYHEQDLSLKTLINYGIKRVKMMIKRYHVALIIPSIFFWFIIEYFHVIGIASTLKIPQFILNQFSLLPVLQYSFYALIFIFFVGHIESSLTLHSYTLDGLTFKHTLKQNRSTLNKNRVKYFVEFILLNIFLNALLYAIYLLIILMIGFIIFITRGQSVVLGLLLTMLYSLYSVFVFVSTLILMPVNFALLSSWYYQNKETQGSKKQLLKFSKIIRKPFEYKAFKPALIISLVTLFALNITAIFTIIAQPREPIEFLNYAQIVAHRGASKDAPENTLSAIELAIQYGADAVEFDVRLSRDLVPVLMHDTTLRRTTNDVLGRRVDNVAFSELLTLDAGSWFSPEFEDEKIPSLYQALTTIKGRAVAFVELKVNSTILDHKTVSIIEELNMTNNVVILSFYREQLSRIRQLNPEIKTLLLLTSFIGDEKAIINYSEVDYYGFERSFIIARPDLIELIQKNNKKVYVWTLGSKADIESTLDFGFDGLITSLPIESRELEYSKNRQIEFIDIIRRLFREI